MRDPKRIRKFCNRLAKAWEMVPDWRFGQLMMNALGEMNVNRDPFFPEEDEMICFLEDYVKKHSPYYVPNDGKSMVVDAYPMATFLSLMVGCDDCEYPCEAKENSSEYNCRSHMIELIKAGKVSVVIRWKKEIDLRPKVE